MHCVVGIATHHYVRATVLDAVRAGFTTRVLRDHAAGVTTPITAQALDDLRAANVAPTGMPVVGG